MSKIAVITGGTSGIGRETALYLAKNGCTVYELSRREEGVEGLKHIRADVTDQESVRRAVEQILQEAGHIDILVNNAGFGISGAVEFTDTEEAQRQFQVNFFGMVRMNRAVIAAMRSRGSGRIVNLSSVAAPVPIPFQTYYSASKAAINSYTMALGNELRPFGITVCAVMPGDIHTGFTAARHKVGQGDEIYAGRISRSVKRMEHDEQTGMDPAKAGAFVGKVALKTSHKPLYTIGFSYKAAVQNSPRPGAELAYRQNLRLLKEHKRACLRRCRGQALFVCRKAFSLRRGPAQRDGCGAFRGIRYGNIFWRRIPGGSPPGPRPPSRRRSWKSCAPRC